MKTYLNAILFTGAVVAASSANAFVLIDDFSSGAFSGSITSGTQFFNSVGTMVGGDRVAALNVQSNAFGLSFNVDANAGVLTLNSQSGVDGRAQIGYGFDYVDPNTVVDSDLNLDLSGESAFNLNLLSRDGDTMVTVFVVGSSGSASSSQMLLGSSINTPEVVSFSFASFGAFNFADVDQVFFEIDTSNTGDVAITSFEAVPEPATMAILAGAAAIAASRKRKK